MLPIAMSVMGLETELSYWHGVKMPGTLHCANLQPWTFFGNGCMTTFGSPIAYGSLITDNHD